MIQKEKAFPVFQADGSLTAQGGRAHAARAVGLRLKKQDQFREFSYTFP